MDIPPDTKDWTWVLTRPCDDCGFDPRSPERDEFAVIATLVGQRWKHVLSAAAEPQRRPDPIVWSALEYGSHVRDVFALADYRVHLMLDEDGPHFANWDQDATAVESDYNSGDPAVVADEIAESAAIFAATLMAVDDNEWTREGRRSDGAMFTVDSFTRYLLHDPIHHLTDVTAERWQRS